MPNAQEIEFNDKKKSVRAVVGKNIETFIIYMTSLTFKITIHLGKKTQIALLIVDKVIVWPKYSD